MPLQRLYSHFCYFKLDVDKMRQAAAYLVGEHDFASFCSASSSARSTVRTIYSLTVEKEGDEIVIQVCGSGFLYNMVRIIAGTLVDVGLGKIKPEQISSIIESKDRTKAGKTLPPHGLFLVSVEYGEY